MINLERGFENLVNETGMSKRAIEIEAGISNGSISAACHSNNIKMLTLFKIAKATNQLYKGEPDIIKLLKTMGER